MDTAILGTGPQEESLESQSDENSATSAPNTIPYSRFSEVVSQKNHALEEAAHWRELAASLTAQKQQNSVATPHQMQMQPSGKPPQFETVEELVAYTEKMTEKKVHEAIKPLAERANKMAFHNTVEHFFATNPDAAQLRDEMNKYTSSMSDFRKETLKEAVARGDTSALNEIFYVVQGQISRQSAQMAKESGSMERSQALSPTQYKVARTSDMTIQDKIQEGIRTKDFSPVFDDLIRKNFGT